MHRNIYFLLLPASSRTRFLVTRGTSIVTFSTAKLRRKFGCKKDFEKGSEYRQFDEARARMKHSLRPAFGYRALAETTLARVPTAHIRLCARDATAAGKRRGEKGGRTFPVTFSSSHTGWKRCARSCFIHVSRVENRESMITSPTCFDIVLTFFKLKFSTIRKFVEHETRTLLSYI